MAAWVGSGVGRFWRYHGRVDCGVSMAERGVNVGVDGGCSVDKALADSVEADWGA